MDIREAYDESRYDPPLLSMDALEIGEVIYEPDDDRKKLEFHRQQVLRTGHLSGDAEDELVTRARMGMNDEEAQFSVLVSVIHCYNSFFYLFETMHYGPFP